MDVSGALQGVPGAAGRTALVTQDNNAAKLGYRSGRWKLVRLPPGKKGAPRPRDALYDLDADPGETTDVAGAHPDVAERLGRALDDVRR
jgi:arylsulfatase A-like enzyme